MKVLAPGIHAKYSASGAYRWSVCSASPSLSEGLEDTPSIYAAEGTVAHDVAALILEGEAPSKLLQQSYSHEGFYFTVDQPMMDAVMVYVRAVWEESKDPEVIRWVEVDLTPELSKIHPDLGGMSDCILYVPATKTLKVWDYKHGAGRYVAVENNTQLRFYALGGLLVVEAMGYQVENVEVVIAQPRCGDPENAVRREQFPAVELLDFEADILEAIERIENNPIAVVGTHCDWCLAAGTPGRCPAMEDAHKELVSSQFADLTQVSPEKIGAAMDLVEALEARCKAIREAAYSYEAKGVDVPGWKLVNKRGTRKWKDPERAATELMAVEGAWTAPKPPELKSPAQVEKAVGKKAFKTTYSGLAEMVSSGYKLAKESDKRPAVCLVSSDDFDKLD